MSYTWVIFDLGGVVVDCEADELLHWMSRLLNRSWDEVQAIVYQPQLLGAFERGRISPQAYYRQLHQQLELPWTYEQFVQAWNSILRENRPVSQLVRQLHSRYRLMALSNTNVLHLEHMTATMPVFSLFEGWVASCEVGVCKPDPRIYHLALQRSGVEPEQAVYIDDRPEFVKAGCEMGLTTIRCEQPHTLEMALRNAGLVF